MALFNKNGKTQKVMNGQFAPIPLGNYIFHSEQQECAYSVRSLLPEQAGTVSNIFPIVIAQPQEGKSGVIIVFIYKMLTEWASAGITGKIMWLANVSNNVLRNQNQDRLDQSKVDPTDEVTVCHLDEESELNKFCAYHKQNPHEQIVIIIDEAHVAQVENGVFQRFMTKMDIRYGIDKPINISVVSVTATPFGHEVANRIIYEKTNIVSNFQYCRLVANSSYYSLEKMVNDNRVFQSEVIFDKGTRMLTQWMCDRVQQFKKICLSDPGNMVLRVNNSKQAETIALLLNKMNLSCTIFSSAGKGKTTGLMDWKRIERLDNCISKNINKAKVLIIIQSGRVGVTFETTENIRMWIDAPGSQADTTVQAIGRCMGYGRKMYDIFPIFCNMDEIQIALNFYKNPMSAIVPSGTQNANTLAATSSRKYGSILVMKTKPNAVNAKQLAKKELEALLNAPNVYAELLALDYADYSRFSKHTFSCNSVATMSESTANPYAEHLAMFSTLSNVISKEKKGKVSGVTARCVRLLHVDKAPLEINEKTKHGLKGKAMSKALQCEKQTADYHALVEAIPTIKGRFVYVLNDEELAVLNKHGLLKNYHIIPKNIKTGIVPKQKLNLRNKSSFKTFVEISTI